MVISVVTLPALLAVLGTAVDSLTLFRRSRGRVGDGHLAPAGHGGDAPPRQVAIAGVTFLVAWACRSWGGVGRARRQGAPRSHRGPPAVDTLRDEFDSVGG